MDKLLLATGVLTVGFVVCATPAPAQNVRLVTDALPVPGRGSMDRSQLVVPGVRPGEVFLVLDDGVHGTELWRSDGTAAGTALVVDLSPGAADSDITWVTLQGSVAWIVLGVPPRMELWRTDGTAAGTVQVLTTAGLLARSLSAPLAWLPNGRFLLSVDGVLARSDGTVAGTLSLGVPFDALLETDRGGLYTLHFASGDVHRTDGTVAGTALVATGVTRAFRALGGLVVVQPGAGGASMLRVLGTSGAPSITVPETTVALSRGDDVVILGTSTLWYWNGSASAQVLATFATLQDPLQPSGIALSRDGSAMLFVADDGVHGREPWWTDFTPAGTHLIADLTPGAADSTIDVMVPVADRALLWAHTPGAGSEPWSTDGTAAGTTFVGDLEPGPAGSVPDVFSGAGAVLGSRRVVFPISISATGFEPWVTDGTATGTRLLADVNPGPASSTGYSGFWGWPAGTSLVFAADDGVHGREPWAIDMEGAASPLPGGCPDAATFLVGDPVIGTPWPLSVRGVSAPGAVLLAQPAAGRVDLGGMCTFVLDPATSVVVAPITPGPQGNWATTFPVPNDAGLRGAAFASQAVTLDPSRPIGFELLGAFWLTVGF